MLPLFSKPRRSVIAGLVASAPLALTLACSDSDSSFFDPPMGGSGKGGSSSGGSAGTSGGTSSAGGASGGKAGAGGGSGGSSGSGGSGAAGSGASGGMTNGGSGGDGAMAGTGGTDPGVGGSAGTDTMGGEGGMGEGGMGGGGSGTAGTAGEGDGGSSMGGTGGTAGAAGSGGTAGSGVGGTSGASGTAGTAGTGGAPCVATTEICDGVDNDCGNDIDEGGVCPSACHGGTREGRTFLLCTTNSEQEWVEAREFCMDADDGDGDVEVAGPMTLVEITSAEENQFLVDWIVDEGIDDNVWHGANDRTQEGQWVWDRGGDLGTLFYTVVGTTRMPVNGAYHDWPTGQPTYGGVDCGVFDADDDFAWDDGACTQGPLNSFICGEIP